MKYIWKQLNLVYEQIALNRKYNNLYDDIMCLLIYVHDPLLLWVTILRLSVHACRLPTHKNSLHEILQPNFGGFMLDDEMIYPPRFLEIFMNTKLIRPTITLWLMDVAISGCTGFLLCLTISVMYIFALQVTRTHVFHMFWITHKLFYIVFLLILLHGCSRIIQVWSTTTGNMRCIISI